MVRRVPLIFRREGGTFANDTVDGCNWFILIKGWAGVESVNIEGGTCNVIFLEDFLTKCSRQVNRMRINARRVVY